MSPHARELASQHYPAQSRAKPCENCAAAPSPLKAAFLLVSRTSTRILSVHSRSSKSLYFTHISLGATPNCNKPASYVALPEGG